MSKFKLVRLVSDESRAPSRRLTSGDSPAVLQVRDTRLLYSLLHSINHTLPVMACIFSATCVCLLFNRAFASEYVFNAPTGDWNQAANWTLAGGGTQAIPGLVDSAMIAGGDLILQRQVPLGESVGIGETWLGSEDRLMIAFPENQVWTPSRFVV